MEGAKGGAKPQQQNKPKQNKKGGGGGGNSKGQGKSPGNPNAGGPKPSKEPQKTNASEVSTTAPPPAEPAKVSIEGASPAVPCPVAAEVKPTADAPQQQHPTHAPQPNLLPEQPAVEGKDTGKGNQQNKGNKSKGGPQNKNANNPAAKNTQGPPAIPPRVGEKPEGKAPIVPDIKTEASGAKETIADEGKTSVAVPAAPQLSVASEQGKEAARAKSPSKNNQNPGKNPKGGKGNKGGTNPPNKNASQPPAVPPRTNQPSPAPEKEQNLNTVPQPIQGAESSSIVGIPKAVEVGSPDSKDNAKDGNAQNASKKSKSQAKGGGSSPKSESTLAPGPEPTPAESIQDKNRTIPVENPQSFAEKAKSPAPKPSNKVQAEKTRAESPAKNEQTHPKNKTGKGGPGSAPQPEAPVAVTLPQEQPPVDLSPVSPPAKIDLPKNQQSALPSPQPPSAPEQNDQKNAQAQKNKNQKKNQQPAKNTSPPAKSGEHPVSALSSDQTSKNSKSSSPKDVPSTKPANASPKSSPDEVVIEEDFEPLFSDLPAPPLAKPSQPAPKESSKPVVKETPKQSVGEALTKTDAGESPKATVKEAPKSAVAEPPKPVIKETYKQPVPETPKPVAKETPKPVAKETPKPVAKETPKPAVKETPKPAVKQTPTALESEGADFDPLFSDLTDSTKALVGVACPFVDKFPPLSPPGAAPKILTQEQKPQAPVGTPAAEPKIQSQQQQSKKSKSPPSKPQAPHSSAQNIPKSAPVEIKAPSAPLGDSPLQGDPILPESWKDKVLSDVKLSSSPKRSASPKLASSPKLSSSPKAVETLLKKEENKNQASDKKANTQTPLVTSVIAAVAEVPLKPEEPKIDASEQPPPLSHKNDKKVANQKSGPSKGHQARAQEASKAPMVIKEDGARSTKLQKGNPNPNLPNQSQATKKDNHHPQNNPKQKEVSKQADAPCSKAKHPFEHPVKTVEPKSVSNHNKNATPKMAAQPHGKADAPVTNKVAPDASSVNKAQPVTPTAPVIPTDPNAPELAAKKESKKSKKNKKDRHRNREREEKGAPTQNGNPLNSLAGEVAKARQHIKNSLQCIDDIANMTSPSAVIEVSNRLNSLEKENSDLKQKVGDLTALLAKLEIRVKDLEKGNKSVGLQAVAPNSTVASQAVAKAAHAASQVSANVKTAASQAKPVPAKQDDDDDGVDLFASESEEEDEEANKIKEQRLAEYAAKKSKKPTLIAKSSIILDIKPWDDETDMKEMEKRVRKIEADGLLWGASKLVPLAYGIHKLQVNCVVEDEKISIDWLQETIEEIEDYVQSVDIAAFNKI